MPSARHPLVQQLSFAGKNIPLKKPMAVYAANRLQAILPQIAALNQAGKSQADAAHALKTTVSTLRAWLDITQTPWRNVKSRGPYNIQSK
jgi:hypothetical protein